MRGFLVLGFLATMACNAGASLAEDETGEVGTSADEITAVCGGEKFVRGVDVSHWQGKVDWAAMKKKGNVFAIARISDGLDFPDREFDRNWVEMKKVGLIRGAYQFFRPGDDAMDQAEMVVKKVGRLDEKDLPVTIDVEASDGVDRATIAMKIARWLHRVEEGTGKKPIIYTGGYFWEENVASSRFGGYPLWTAHYGTDCPNVPEPWPAWTIWQYSTTNDTLDRNVFNGTLADLEAFAKSSVTSIPAAEGKETCPAGPGLYCGGNMVAGETTTLYSCTYGELTAVGLCARGCDKKPAFENDACNPCPHGDGHYCGGESDLAGEKGTLYQCTDGILAPIQKCAEGCFVAPPGQSDRCK